MFVTEGFIVKSVFEKLNCLGVFKYVLEMEIILLHEDHRELRALLCFCIIYYVVTCKYMYIVKVQANGDEIYAKELILEDKCRHVKMNELSICKV